MVGENEHKHLHFQLLVELWVGVVQLDTGSQMDRGGAPGSGQLLILKQIYVSELLPSKVDEKQQNNEWVDEWVARWIDG